MQYADDKQRGVPLLQYFQWSEHHTLLERIAEQMYRIASIKVSGKPTQPRRVQGLPREQYMNIYTSRSIEAWWRQWHKPSSA